MVRENIRNLDWQSLLRRISELTSRALHPMSVNPDDANLVEYIQFCNFLQYKIAKDGVIPVDEFIVMLAKSVDSDNIAENESKYKNITTSNYKFELRFSDHYINCWNFSVINRSSDFGYSIVIKKRNLRRRTRFIPKENANYVEFVYFEDSITADLQIAIVEGLKQILLKNDISAMPLVGRMHFSGIYNQEFGKNWELADTTTNGLGTYEEAKFVNSFKPRFNVGDWISTNTLKGKLNGTFVIIQVTDVIEDKTNNTITYKLSYDNSGVGLIDTFTPVPNGFSRKSNGGWVYYNQNKFVGSKSPKFKIGDDVTNSDRTIEGKVESYYILGVSLDDFDFVIRLTGGFQAYEKIFQKASTDTSLATKELDLIKADLNKTFVVDGVEMPYPKFKIGDYVKTYGRVFIEDRDNEITFCVESIFKDFQKGKWGYGLSSYAMNVRLYEDSLILKDEAYETTEYQIGDYVSIVGTSDTGVISKIETEWNNKGTAITHIKYTINNGKEDVWEVGNEDIVKLSDSSKSDTTTNGLGNYESVGDFLKFSTNTLLMAIREADGSLYYKHGFASAATSYLNGSQKLRDKCGISNARLSELRKVFEYGGDAVWNIATDNEKHIVCAVFLDYFGNDDARKQSYSYCAMIENNLLKKELDLIKADLNLPQPKFKVGDWVSPIGSELMKDMPAFEYYRVVGISLGWDNTPQYSTSYNRIFRESELRKEKISIVPKFQIGDDIQTKYKGNIVRAKCGGFRYIARNQKIFYTFKNFIMPDIAENKIAAVSDDSGNIKVGDWVRCPDAAFPDNAEQVLKIHENGDVETSDRHDLTNLSMWKMEDLKKIGSSFTPKFKIGDNVVSASEKDQILTIKDYYVNTRNYDVMYRSVGSDDKRWHLNRESDIELYNQPNRDIKVGDWAHSVRISEPYYISQVINVDDKKITLSDVLFGKNKKLIPNIDNRYELTKYEFEATPKFKIGDKVVGISDNYKDIKQTLNIVGYYALPKTHEIMYQCIGNMDKDEHKCREYEIELWKHDYEPNSKFNKIASKVKFKVGDWVNRYALSGKYSTDAERILKIDGNNIKLSDGKTYEVSDDLDVIKQNFQDLSKGKTKKWIAMFRLSENPPTEPKYNIGDKVYIRFKDPAEYEGFESLVPIKTCIYSFDRGTYVYFVGPVKHNGCDYSGAFDEKQISDYQNMVEERRKKNFDFDPNDSFYSRFLGAITEEGADGLLQATNYDTKHKLNLAPDKRIPESVVEDLRKEGLTIEKIDALAKDGYPVCKYKTQVTIHGICPTLKSNRSAGGYVTLVVNDNKSLGVRWRAIDEKKKYDIVRILGWFGYRYKEDSQNFVITRSISALRNPKDPHSNMSHEEEEAKYKELQATFQKLIDNNLFFGEVRIGKPTHSWFSINYFHVAINIDGIYQKNIKPFIETILGMKYSDVEAEIARLRKEAEEEQKAYEEQRKKEAAERDRIQKIRAEKIEKLKAEKPIPPEFEKTDKLSVGDIAIFYNITGYGEDVFVDFDYKLVYLAFGKMRWKDCDYDGKPLGNRGSEILDKGPYYVKRTIKQAPAPQREVKDVAIDSNEATDFKILRYSDKAYILTGNTKPYAAILGRKGGMGLKWGTYWKNSQYDPIPNGTGWMFGEQLKPKVEEFIAKYQKTESKPEKPEVSEILIHELNLLK